MTPNTPIIYTSERGAQQDTEVRNRAKGLEESPPPGCRSELLVAIDELHGPVIVDHLAAPEQWRLVVESIPLLKNIVRLSLLESVSPELLVRFLQPYEAYLLERGLNLGAAIDEQWLSTAFQVFNRLDPDMPVQLQQAFIDVSELANDEGHERILTAAGQSQLSLFPEPRTSVVDVAFRVFLEQRSLFQNAQTLAQSKAARRFIEFCPAAVRPLLKPDSNAKQMRLRSRVGGWFGRRNQTDFCELRVTADGDEVCFLFIRGRAPQNRGAIEGDRRTRLSWVPEKQDTVIFRHATGGLAVDASYPAEQDFYRRVFGEVFFHDPEHFLVDELFTGQPLIDQGAEALSAEGIEGLVGVALREVELRPPQPSRFQVRLKDHDIGARLQEALVREAMRARSIHYMKLVFDLPSRPRPLPVEITVPNKMRADRRIGEDLVREFLLVRGFMQLPEQRLAMVG